MFFRYFIPPALKSWFYTLFLCCKVLRWAPCGSWPRQSAIKTLSNLFMMKYESGQEEKEELAKIDLARHSSLFPYVADRDYYLRQKVLDELVAQAQELRMGYENTYAYEKKLL
jgi:hypothetical protein